MSANTCQSSDIYNSVVLCAEATIAPTVANKPTQFKFCDKTELRETGQERMLQFVIPPELGSELNNTGTNVAVFLVHRFVRFGVEIKHKRNKADFKTFRSYIDGDLKALSDRIQWKLRDYEATAGALAGLINIQFEGEYRTVAEGDVFYSTIYFRADFTDDMVLT